MKKCGLVGFGGVGYALAKILAASEEDRLVIDWIVDRSWDKRVTYQGRSEATKSQIVMELFGEDCKRLDNIEQAYAYLHSTDVIIEVTGAIDISNPLMKYLKKVQKTDKKFRLVSANKATIATHMPEWFRDENAAIIGIEAAVAVSVPIIQSIMHQGAITQFDSMTGILNGTTNYVLGEIENRVSPEVALKKAVALGYAEPGGRGDLDGADAANKLCIAARLATGIQTTPDKLRQNKCILGIGKSEDGSGMDGISYADFLYAGLRLDSTIKHIATFKCQRNVPPKLITLPVVVPLSSALGKTGGVGNTIIIESKGIGKLELSGKGAGTKETAMVLLNDALHESALAEFKTISSDEPIAAQDIEFDRWMVRASVYEGEGLLEYIFGVMKKHGLQVDEVFQFHGKRHKRARKSLEIDRKSLGMSAEEFKAKDPLVFCFTLNKSSLGDVHNALKEAFPLSRPAESDQFEKSRIPSLKGREWLALPIIADL